MLGEGSAAPRRKQRFRHEVGIGRHVGAPALLEGTGCGLALAEQPARPPRRLRSPLRGRHAPGRFQDGMSQGEALAVLRDEDRRLEVTGERFQFGPDLSFEVEVAVDRYDPRGWCDGRRDSARVRGQGGAG
ncbi:MAG: hypothetical protein KatS3mg061_1298 [Dehalococcoidia bacterium]|nr:MAG: hypothetical protein KatS3mg061_1298 [Dehalococcoidia bacterium]